MLKLRTIYSYGLNERVGVEYKNEETYELVGKRFLPSWNRWNHRVECHERSYIRIILSQALMILSINLTGSLLMILQILVISAEH